MSLTWNYGVTTVPDRRYTTLPKTIESLERSGFDSPRLFVDGDSRDQPRFYLSFDAVTFRCPRVRTYANWFMSLLELYLRDPFADRYALFQDDLVACLGLREYLEACEYPAQGYLNLYTVPRNEARCPSGKWGWYLSNQMGKGALALVFSNEAVRLLLKHEHLVERPRTDNPVRRWKSVDGAVSEAFKQSGWKEWVHSPSLVQHTGLETTMGNRLWPLSTTFPGEDFNAKEILPCVGHTS